MGMPRPKERRFGERIKAVKHLPGQLLFAESGEEIDCRPLDVSEFGMGVFTEEELPEEEENYILRVGELDINLLRVYHLESPGDAVGYRSGFRVMDPEIDLMKVFTEAGCFYKSAT